MNDSIQLLPIESQDSMARRSTDEDGGYDTQFSTIPLLDNETAALSREDSSENLISMGSQELGDQRPAARSCLRWPTGWRKGATLSALIIFAILVVNITVTVLCSAKVRDQGYNSSIAPLLAGNCKYIKRLGIIIHLAINLASTLLLGASNYCMQAISAPTRKDIDAAHAEASWLYIGVPNIRNLRHMRKRRVFVWMLLGITSIPLHLVYNASFYVSATGNLYSVWYADESFIDGASFNESRFRGDDIIDVDPWSLQKKLMAGDDYEKLSNKECVEAYTKPLVEDRGNLVLVVEPVKNGCVYLNYSSVHMARQKLDCDAPSRTSLYNMFKYNVTFDGSGSVTNESYSMNSTLYFYNSTDGSYTVDKKYNDDYLEYTPDQIKGRYYWVGDWNKQLEAGHWEQGSVNVTYCLSEKVKDQCRLNVAVTLLTVVIAFNAAKLVLVIIVATTDLINYNPLVTLGDAAASFIRSPDQTTAGLCLIGAEDMETYSQEAKRQFGYPSPQLTRAKRYKSKSIRLATTIPPYRWLLAGAMTVWALAIILAFLAYASLRLESTFEGQGTLKSMWSNGLGVATPYNIIQWSLPSTGDSAVVLTVLIVNLPQILLSFIYLVFNTIVTAMATESEWSTFAQGAPQTLRVSFPEKGQKSTFFLQLPYKYSLPMLATSALIHWLISQSIFLAQIIERQLWTYNDINDPLEKGAYNTTITAAFSPMGIVLTLVAFITAVTAVLGLSLFRLKSGIPVVGCCSLVISAACHPPEGTLTTLPLKWGVVREQSSGIVGHCSFSNDDIDLPQEGREYA